MGFGLVHTGRRAPANVTPGGAVGWKIVADTIIRTLRNVREALIATAQQLSRRRIVTLILGIVILVAIGLFVPLPTAVQLRDWSTSVGPWFPAAFLLTHVVATVFPFPRTAFTLAAGLLFGWWWGALIAVAASTASAVIALALVRLGGWQLSHLVSHPAVDAVDARLRQRGWLAVLSLRLIPVVPFAVVNYAAGASAVRVVPYSLATLVGVLPGTVAVVILGDAITGSVSPALGLVSLATASLGMAGLLYEVRKHRAAEDTAGRDTEPQRD